MANENGEIRRYKITVEYDGTDFSGWQTQPTARTVQATLEEAIQSLTQTKVAVHGSGRTDAGVHGRGVAAHFDLASPLLDEDLRKGLNAILPSDVAIHELVPVDSDWHARFNASSRLYTYTIVHRKEPLLRRQAWLLFGDINADSFTDLVPELIGTHDFAGFSKRREQDDHTFCHVFEAKWEQEEHLSRFTLRANRFLYGMVRCIVGGLIQVGRDSLGRDEFMKLLKREADIPIPMLAPAIGLVLEDVRYDPAERKVVGEAFRKVGAHPVPKNE
ncbi:MAG: tRNA pseudouridine(38-40) synthase TruA [Ectothiorhodospiraceae bacterium]|nr:tRNA pseudouridine(38-40) synthase TruA [Ectothiorhodospiraceae bacterium]